MLRSEYLESQADLPGYQLLHGREHDRVTHFFPLTVALHLPIQSWRLSGLGVRIVRPDSVDLRPMHNIFRLEDCVMGWTNTI